MDCALWLNRRKIFSADEIRENYDAASIRGYFLGGSLEGWLRTHGGAAFADKLAGSSPDDPHLDDKLAEIFGAGDDRAASVSFRSDAGAECPPPVSGSYNGSYRYPGSGSYRPLSGSGASGSGLFAALGGSGVLTRLGGSYRFGSFGFGSFMYLWEWEWEWRFGSFFTGSYRFGSGSFMYEWEWEWERRFGSFALGSYTFGSYKLGSFYNYPGGSFTWGSFRAGLPHSGEVVSGVPDMMTPDEYDRIMYMCLSQCPLDRFGYGIHLI